jgi:predicted flavoprotein YhiN
VLKSFPAAAVRAWFEEHGVPLKEEPGGKLFPVTDSATDGGRALASHGLRRRRHLPLREPVTDLEAAGEALASHDTSGGLTARAVILATGGLSFPKTGSDGSGYRLATGLGHTLSPRNPALTPLVVAGDALSAPGRAHVAGRA